MERGQGSALGDYLGIPLNEAGRLRADTFDAGEWSLQDLQCRPHPVPYQWRAQGGMRISKEIDSVYSEMVDYHVAFVRSIERDTINDGCHLHAAYAYLTRPEFFNTQFI